MAENLGISRQAMSQFLAEMAENKLVELVPDPADRRARIVQFAPESHAIRAARVSPLATLTSTSDWVRLSLPQPRASNRDCSCSSNQ